MTHLYTYNRFSKMIEPALLIDEQYIAISRGKNDISGVRMDDPISEKHVSANVPGSLSVEDSAANPVPLSTAFQYSSISLATFAELTEKFFCAS